MKLLQVDRKTKWQIPISQIKNAYPNRWAVGVKPDGFLQLELQGLPAPAAVVRARPLLRMDDVAAVQLAAWDISIPWFEGRGPVRGPVPVIFAENQEEIRTAIDRDEKEFGQELNSFMKR
jgi:hypothetical protein